MSVTGAGERLSDILGDVRHFAHRGMWDGEIPENSLEAILRAADKGLGLETDVHLTRDGGLAIFHDHRLRRMCGVSGIVEEKTMEELRTLRLRGTGHRIPSLAEVLEGVNGRVPLLLELKCRGNETELCRALEGALEGYAGKYLYIGFSARAAAYFRERGYVTALSCFLPRRARGLDPDVLICSVFGLPSVRRAGKLPPIISWSASNESQKRRSEERCVGTILNTRRFDM